MIKNNLIIHTCKYRKLVAEWRVVNYDITHRNNVPILCTLYCTMIGKYSSDYCMH